METKLTRLLKIKEPIIQAPIGSATNPILASEVSNAGGLGMLALSWKENKKCIEIIHKTKSLTDRPFGVNLVLNWKQDERVQICIDEKVPIVSFFWGDSSKYISSLQENGIKVCQTVTNTQEALHYERLGVDFLLVQGWEAGGHVQGSVANSILVPAISAKVNIPIAAAGGFTDGRGLVAALALGASGICMGTRFLMSSEANIEDRYAEILEKANENDTIYLKNLFHIGWENAAHRVIKNSTVNDWENAGNPQIGNRPNEGQIIGHDQNGNDIYRYSDNNPIKGFTGDLEAMALYAGQSVGLLNKRINAKEIVNQTILEAENIINNLSSYNKKNNQQ